MRDLSMNLHLQVLESRRTAACWVLSSPYTALHYPTHLWPAAQSSCEQIHSDGFWDTHRRRSLCSISKEATLRRLPKQKGKDPCRWSQPAEMQPMSEMNHSVLLRPRMARKETQHISLMAKSHLTYISWPSHSKQACPWNRRRTTELLVWSLCTIQHSEGVGGVETMSASVFMQPLDFCCNESNII